MIRSSLFLGIFLSFFLSPAFPKSQKPQGGQTEPPKQQAPTDVKVPLLTAPLRLADFEGMAPRADLRDQLA